MQAVGLRLEENGTVLALREDGCSSGTKWNCVPGNVLKRLNTAAKASRQIQRVAWAISVHRDRPLHGYVRTFGVSIDLRVHTSETIVTTDFSTLFSPT